MIIGVSWKSKSGKTKYINKLLRESNMDLQIFDSKDYDSIDLFYNDVRLCKKDLIILEGCNLFIVDTIYNILDIRIYLLSPFEEDSKNKKLADIIIPIKNCYNTNISIINNYITI